ncbi:MAG TPA: hypothetical protein VMG58_00380 [Candidatus Sulfotelmatobacter sp.]|nr:hypothetical protein [Candidatus Sulfotelmatobacter sp.]
MTRLLTFSGALLGGYAGWYLGDGFGTAAAFIASGVGSVAGVYLGWRLARKIEE